MMKKLLSILRDNARTPIRQIADRLGRKPKEVETMIAKLEKNGTILGYHAVINPEKAPGPTPVLGIIEIKVTPQRDVGYDGVAGLIAKHRQVHTVYLISGQSDLVVMVEGKSLHEVADFVAQRLATIKGVEATTTHFLLRKYKENGIIIHGEPDSAERLPVTP